MSQARMSLRTTVKEFRRGERDSWNVIRADSVREEEGDCENQHSGGFQPDLGPPLNCSVRYSLCDVRRVSDRVSSIGST